MTVKDRFLTWLDKVIHGPRVLWTGIGEITETQRYHEDERSSYYYIVYTAEFHGYGELELGTDLDEECAWMYQGQQVRATIEED